MYYFCKNNAMSAVVMGENRADAALKLDKHIHGVTDQRMMIDINHDGDTNAFCGVLLSEWEVTELHRHDVLEWVERKLDGDNSISILM
jgi:hypothetical protein